MTGETRRELARLPVAVTPGSHDRRFDGCGDAGGAGPSPRRHCR